jgi:3'-phosphoadenosine 5'-phosphosulfate sulfotransferase (PAPS reductase)/FAD synthetase
VQTELFALPRPDPATIVADAIELYKPVAAFALFSGGDGSLAATHWAMTNLPGCQVAHIDTGIGIPRTQEFVRETCGREGWPLTVIRAKEDCGQDYDQIIREHGFPGPASHGKMYSRLKERGIRELVRRNKKKHTREKVMLLTGICHDDSVRRSGYGNALITPNGGQLWVNHMYWRGATWMHLYVQSRGIPRNPVAYELGMSGECLCGAFASKGELAVVRMVCPEVADRIERLQVEARAAGHNWGWEDRPPKERADNLTQDMFLPMCRGCLKEQERRAA